MSTLRLVMFVRQEDEEEEEGKLGVSKIWFSSSSGPYTGQPPLPRHMPLLPPAIADIQGSV